MIAATLLKLEDAAEEVVRGGAPWSAEHHPGAFWRSASGRFVGKCRVQPCQSSLRAADWSACWGHCRAVVDISCLPVQLGRHAAQSRLGLGSALLHSPLEVHLGQAQVVGLVLVKTILFGLTTSGQVVGQGAWP